MAVMGLKINQPSGGLDTSLADTLAKALFGDPEREMKLAMARRQYDTEALQQAHIQAQTDKLVNDEAALTAAVPAYRKIYRHNLDNSGQPEQLDPTTAPAPVDLNFTPPAAVPATTVEPVPVEPDAMPDTLLPQPSLPDQMPTTQSQVPAATTLPAGVEPVPVEIGNVGADAMPDNVLPAPPDTITRPQDITLPPEVEEAVTKEVQRRTDAGEQLTDEDIDAMIMAQLRQGGNFGQTIGSNIGLSGIVYGDPADAEAARRNTVLYTGSNPPTGKTAPGEFNEGEQKLRKEYQARPEVQRFDIIQTRYKDLLKGRAQANGVGDTVMIYAMIKMLDPTSSVMGGEQVTAQNAPGLIPAQIVQFNNLLEMKGDKFDDPGREQFVKAATEIYKTNSGDVKRVNDYFTKLATDNGLKPENIIYPTDAAPDTNPPGITEEMIAQTMASNPGYTREQAIKLITDRLEKSGAG